MTDTWRLENIPSNQLITRRTIANVPYSLTFSLPTTIGHYSHAFWRVDGSTLKLRAWDRLSTQATLVDVLGAELNEEYSLSSGSLQLGSYTVVDEEGRVMGRPTVALWVSGELALAAELEFRGQDWLGERIQELSPAIVDSSVVVNSEHSQSLSQEADSLFLTIGELGAVDLHPKESFIVPSGEGLEVAAGDLFYAGDSVEGTRLVLVTATSVAEIEAMACSDVDSCLEAVSRIVSMERTGGRET